MNEWRIAGASVIGTGHEDKGGVVEDKIHSMRKQGVAVIALCDGVGSARFSADGAELFSETISSLLVNSFDELYESDVLSPARLIASLLTELRRRYAPERENDYAATLLAVAVKDNRYILLHLGDGIIGALDSGKLRLLSGATNFGYANVTVAVTSKGASDFLTIQRGELENLTAFFMMSDGAQESLYSSSKDTFADILYAIIDLVREDEQDAAEQLEEVIRLKFRERTRDDCSLIVLAHGEATSEDSWDDYASLSYEGKANLLDKLPKNQRKGVSVKKVDQLLLAIIEEPRTRDELLLIWGKNRRCVFEHAIRLLIAQELIDFNPSKNQYFCRYSMV